MPLCWGHHVDPSKVSVVALGPVTLECEGKLYAGTERATCTPTDPQPMDLFLCIYLPNTRPELDPGQGRSAHSYQTYPIFQKIPGYLLSPLSSYIHQSDTGSHLLVPFSQAEPSVPDI